MSLSPYDKAGIRRLVALLERASGPPAAIRAYEDAVDRLERDLGIAPSAESRELVARIRSAGEAPPGLGDGERSEPEPRGPAPSVTEPGSPASVTGDRSPESIGPARRPPARLRRVALGLVAVSAVLASGLVLRANIGSTGDATIAPEPDPGALRRVAVLPFANLSADPAGEYLGAGTADELRRRLSGLGDVVIVAGSSMARYRATQLGTRELGRELGAGTLIEGVVRESGGTIRVTVHFVDAASEATIWSHDFEGASGESWSYRPISPSASRVRWE